MFVVAVTRWAQAFEAELPALAQVLGEQVYDLRLKLAGALPVYPYRGPDLARAQAVLALLRGRGHGAVACDLEQVRASDVMFCARSVELGTDAAVFEHGNTREPLPFSQLLAVIHALESNEVDATQKSKERKLSLGRAALSGGLMWSKTETTEKQSQSRDAEQVLYLFRRSGEMPVLLRQHSLRLVHAGHAPRTSVETFQILIAELQRLAPHALYDKSLLTRKRKTTIASHAVTTNSSFTSHSNASDNDLAAHVLALAFLTQQL